MSTAQDIVQLLKAEEERLAAQYPATDIRAHRIITSKALILAPEGFFTRFDNAVHHGVQTVRQSGARTQADVLQAIRSYVDTLNTTDTSKNVVSSLMISALFGFDIIDPLFRERSIHEIHVAPDGSVSISVHGAQRPVESIRFRDAKHISTVLNKILKKASSKKKVNAHLIYATLTEGVTMEVRQTSEGFAFNIFKDVAQRADTAVSQDTPQQAQRQAGPRRERPAPKNAKKAPRKAQRPAERNTAPQQEQGTEESPWKVDPKTGKRYKMLPGIDHNVIRDARKSGAKSFSLEQLQEHVNNDPDFDGDDLNKSAEIFMAHLRVPPNKEEQERLRQEKRERIARLKEEHPEEWGIVTE